MWRLGFFFHEMAFGLLPVLLPLYVIAIGGSLVDVGLMVSSALFAAIPFSFYWGSICDKTRRYKRYILLSFGALAVILYLFTLTTSVELLIILYVVMWIFHVAHEPPKNVLIAELYPHADWERAFSFYETLVKVGWLSGLLLGFIVSTYGFDAKFPLLLCSALNLAAFTLSLVLVKDPPLIFERSLVKIEKTMDFAYRGIVLASKMLDGMRTEEKLKRENPYAFCSGLVLSSLATSIFSTPLPIFFSKNLAISANLVFMIFLLSSSGGVAGYLLALIERGRQKGKTRINKVAMFKCILAFLLAAVTLAPLYASALASLILTLMGLTQALFLVYALSISMELIPVGKAGLFNVLVSVGGACGSFIGPFIAETMGFIHVFLISGLFFLTAYIALKVF